jgi:hypothetical protein
MELSKQITDRMEQLAQAERQAAFRDYAERAFSKAERLIGQEITNREEILPLIEQAFEKGIAPKRLGELLAQAQEQE